MGIATRTYRDFLNVLEGAKHTCDLFGFILFDDRPQHKPIKQFCVENFPWFDDLATQCDMIFFVPIDYVEDPDFFDGEDPPEGEYEDADIELPKSEPYKNCSLKIANHFNIRPNQLPAFLFFTLKQGEFCVEHSAHLQFRTEAFDGAAQNAQNLITDVFSAVTTARSSHGDRELIFKLQDEIARIKRAEGIRPIKTWGKEFVLSLANLPADIARTLAQAGIKRLAGA